VVYNFHIYEIRFVKAGIWANSTPSTEDSWKAPTQIAEWSHRMSPRYEVTGYDRKTGRLVASYDVPARKISSIKNIADVPACDDGLGSYPLNRDQVSAIAKVLETPIVEESIDFFLEAYDGRVDQPTAQ
jgi:hypothetical protein